MLSGIATELSPITRAKFQFCACCDVCCRECVLRAFSTYVWGTKKGIGVRLETLPYEYLAFCQHVFHCLFKFYARPLPAVCPAWNSYCGFTVVFSFCLSVFWRFFGFHCAAGVSQSGQLCEDWINQIFPAAKCFISGLLLLCLLVVSFCLL